MSIEGVPLNTGAVSHHADGGKRRADAAVQIDRGFHNFSPRFCLLLCDEGSLFLACSGLAFERDPLPDAIKNQREWLRVGLHAVYVWYERNAHLAACVLRDAEHHALTKEMVSLRFGARMAAYHEVLGAKLNTKQRAILHLALSFFTWRALVRQSGSKQKAAVEAIGCDEDEIEMQFRALHYRPNRRLSKILTDLSPP